MTLSRLCDIGLHKSIGWFDAFSDLAKIKLNSQVCTQAVHGPISLLETVSTFYPTLQTLIQV